MRHYLCLAFALVALPSFSSQDSLHDLISCAMNLGKQQDLEKNRKISLRVFSLFYVVIPSPRADGVYFFSSEGDELSDEPTLDEVKKVAAEEQTGGYFLPFSEQTRTEKSAGQNAYLLRHCEEKYRQCHELRFTVSAGTPPVVTALSASPPFGKPAPGKKGEFDPRRPLSLTGAHAITEAEGRALLSPQLALTIQNLHQDLADSLARAAKAKKKNPYALESARMTADVFRIYCQEPLKAPEWVTVNQSEKLAVQKVLDRYAKKR